MDFVRYVRKIKEVLPVRIANLETALEYINRDNSGMWPVVAVGTFSNSVPSLNTTPHWAPLPCELADVFIKRELNAATKEYEEGLKRLEEWEKIINGREGE